MTSSAALPGGTADLEVTESAKGRTTRVRLPNGEIATRTSKTMTYAHAVVVTEDNHAHAAEIEQLVERRKAYVEALQAWIDRGSNMAELKAYPSRNRSYAEKQAGVPATEYYLPGFEPEQKTVKASRRFGGGGRYWQDAHQFSLPNPDDKRDYYRGQTIWEAYGPEFVIGEQRKFIESEQAQAGKLRAGDQYGYGVWRWSGDFGNAMSYANQVSGGEYATSWRSARVVGVGSDVKETPKPKGPTPEEREAAKAVRAAADKQASADRDVKFVTETRERIQRNIAEGLDPEGPLKFMTEKGLRFLAKAYGVKLPRLPRDAYGQSQPLDRDNARKLIVEAIRNGG